MFWIIETCSNKFICCVTRPKSESERDFRDYDMFTERVHYILHVVLGMFKVSVKWVPLLLNANQKREMARIWNDNSKLFTT